MTEEARLGVAEPAGSRTRQALLALVEAMIPSGGAFPEGARDLNIDEQVERFVAAAGLAGPRLLRLFLGFFDLSPFFLPPLRMRRFSRLSLDERVEVLDAWEGSRWMPRRQAIHTLKLLITSHFYSHPTIEDRLKYPHPLVRVPRSGGGS